MIYNQKYNSLFVYKFIIAIFLFSTSYTDDDYNPSTFVFPSYYHTYGIHKAGATHLFFFMGLKVRFKNPQGLACVKLESCDDPDDPHDDDELTVYGVNSGQNNIIYNKSMLALDVYGIDEKGIKKLNGPHGICANNAGDVYVADTNNHRIVRLFNPGHHLGFVSYFGKEGKEPGQFKYPEQVALDNNGNIYVSDTGNNRIQAFNRENNLKYIIDNDGMLSAPTGIAVTDSNEKHSYYEEDMLIVIDSCKHRINKFDLSGNLIKRINSKKFGYDSTQLEYVCLDYYNQLLITDSQNHCVHKLNKNLQYIVSFGREGNDDYEFIEPRGITIYRRFGQLFIAEKSAAHYYWVGTDFLFLNTEVERNAVFIEFKITEPAWVEVHILDKDNRFVSLIYRRIYFPGGKVQRIKWNMKMGYVTQKFLEENNYRKAEIIQPQHKVPPGEYTFRIIAEATYSSRSYLKRIEERKVIIE